MVRHCFVSLAGKAVLATTVLATTVLATTVLAACSSPDADDATTTEAPTAETVSTAAAIAMAEVDTLAFVVERTGAEVAIDDAGLIVFERADGRFAAPDAADAIVSVSAIGNRLELGAVVIDGQLWLTDPITGDWQDVTGTIEFDPARIFSVEVGIPAILGGGLTDAELMVSEPDAEGRLQLRGTVAAEDVTTLTSGLVTEAAEADVWIDAQTSRVVEIRFDTVLGTADDGSAGDDDESDEAETTAIWILELSDFGSTVDISPPDLPDSD